MVNYNVCPVTGFFNTVKPEVEVTATLTRVVVGNSTTLTCTVTRSIPMGSYTYRWVHNNSITLSETSSMLTVSIMTESDVGVYRCEVNNSADLTGSNTTTIELGGKYWQYSHYQQQVCSVSRNTVHNLQKSGYTSYHLHQIVYLRLYACRAWEQGYMHTIG